MNLTEQNSTLEISRWSDNPPWLKAFRGKNRDAFELLGLPTTRLEDWKYTDIQEVVPFISIIPEPCSPTLIKANLKKELLKLENAHQLVFVNGFFAEALSSKNLNNGICIQNIAQALDQDNSVLKKYVSTNSLSKNSALFSLNNAFIEDGTFIYIPKNTTIREPIYIAYINTHEKLHTQYPRNIIIVDEGAKVQIIEDYSGIHESSSYFTNALTEITLHKNATCDYYKLDRESKDAFHIATIDVRQEAHSSFISHSLSFGGKLIRNTLTSTLQDKGASCTFNGLFMITANQHLDNHTTIHHMSPECMSHETYHGILDNKSHGVFNGKILVDQYAQKTQSHQTNRSLLLSNEAHIDTKPELQIYADDVECKHGATIGKLDEESLYYLRSRGIERDEARKILTLAFAESIIANFSLKPLQDCIETIIHNKLQR